MHVYIGWLYVQIYNISNYYYYYLQNEYAS